MPMDQPVEGQNTTATPRSFGVHSGSKAQPELQQSWTRTVWWIFACGILSLGIASPTWAAKCLFVSSYHHGYAWSDGVERGVRAVLEGHCELMQFDMDAKRHKDPQDIQQKA